MTIDPRQPIPLYFQLKTFLRDGVLSGEYGPGERLPTEHELCERFGISRTPVTRALSELAAEGVIIRHRRRGTFVNPHWLHRHPGRAEARVLVQEEGPWSSIVREAAAAERIPLSLVTVPRASLHRALTHAVAEGQAPDLAVFDSVWLTEFAVAGFLHALEDLDGEWVRREYERDFLEPLVAATRHDGRTFGVSAFADVAGLWYSHDELERAGQRPPQTWDELAAVAAAVARPSMPHPVAMPGGSKGGETTAYCLIAFLASNRAQVIGGNEVTVSSRAATETLAFLRSLLDELVLPPAAVAYEWNQSIRLLAQRQAAISVGGSYEGPALAERLGLPLEDVWAHVGFAPIPAGPRGAPASVAGTMAHAVFRQSAQPMLALRLIQRIVAPESLARVAAATGRIPSRRSAVALLGTTFPFLAQTAEMLEFAVTRPQTPLYPRVSEQLQAMVEAVLTGRLEPAAAAHRAAEMIGAITGLPLASEQADASAPIAAAVDGVPLAAPSAP